MPERDTDHRLACPPARWWSRNRSVTDDRWWWHWCLCGFDAASLKYEDASKMVVLFASTVLAIPNGALYSLYCSRAFEKILAYELLRAQAIFNCFKTPTSLTDELLRAQSLFTF
jgi:hypothetical protein